MKVQFSSEYDDSGHDVTVFFEDTGDNFPFFIVDKDGEQVWYCTMLDAAEGLIEEYGERL